MIDLDFMLTESIIERFWDRVEKSDPLTCWTWTGSMIGDPPHATLPVTRRGRSTSISAARLSFYLEYHYWPGITRRSCENPFCVNPAHLVDGYEQDNEWIVNRFWEKVDIREPGECWPWKGAAMRGSGIVQFNGERRSARRVSFHLATGLWPSYVDVTCGNSLCVNPAHLTTADRRLKEQLRRLKNGNV